MSGVEFQVEAIGYARSTRLAAEDDDWGRESSRIELIEKFPPDSLAGLSNFSHCEILYLFHQVDESRIVTERSADAFVSVAAYPRWVTLFFLHGKSLADPKRLLEGEGKQVRGIRLERPSDIGGPDIAALIAQAARAHTAAFLAAPRLKTAIKSVSAKRRPRRTA